MIKNTSGQHVGFEMLSKTDGSHVTTGTPVVYVTGDGGTQAVGLGSITHKGNGDWNYSPTQAETNYDHIRFLMTLTDAFSQLVNVYTTSPQTGDAYAAVNLLNDISVEDVNAQCDAALADYDGPTNAEMEARTLPSADYFDPNSDTVANVTTVETTTNVTNQTNANITAISGDTIAADNLEAMYDGTGYIDETAPSSRGQVSSLSSGSGAISNTADSFTKSSTEPETNTYTHTHELDGVYHIVEDVLDTTDAYYEFSIGGNGVPVEIIWDGYAQSNADSYAVYAYNWDGADWDQIGTVNGTSGTTHQSLKFNMTIAHVGSGANLGKVRFRFYSTNGTAFATDRILCSYVIVTKSVGYANGAIWIDTVNGTAGTESFVNGTADNPVNTLADALIIAGNVGLSRFQNAPQTSVTLTSDSTGLVGVGENWSLNLGGQIVTNGTAVGAYISGIADATSTGTKAIDCIFNTSTLAPIHAEKCAIAGTITLAATGTYIFSHCYSAVAGGATPVLDMGAAIGASYINFRDYSGGIEIQNMGTGDTMSLEGRGQLVVNANCTAGSIHIRGLFTVTDNSGGAVTIVDDARYDVDQINAQCDIALIDYDGPTKTEIDDAFSEIKGSGWSALTDTLRHIRDKQTDIETDTGTDIPALLIIIDSVVDAIKAVTDNLPDSGSLTSLATAANLTIVDTVVDGIQSDLDNATDGLGALKSLIDVVDANVDLTLADTNEIQSDLVDGGRLDLLIDAIKAKTDNLPIDPADQSDVEAYIDALQAHGDLNWGSSGENPNVLLSAEISSITNQTEFTLITGSDQDDAYNGQSIVLYDDSNSDYPSVRKVTDYIGLTKTVTIDSAADFTLGADDSVRIFVTAPGTTAPTVEEIRTEMDSNSTQFATIVEDTGTTIPGQISALNDLSAAEVNTEVDNALSDYDAPTKTEMDSAFTEIKGSTFSGTTDSLEAIRDRGDLAWISDGAAPTVEEIRTEIDLNSSKLASILTDTETTIPGLLSIIDTVVDAIKAVTDNLPDSGALTSIAQAFDLNTVSENVDSILVDTGTTLPSTLAALNDISIADIIAGISDGSYDLQEMLRIMFSVLAGKSTGGGTNSLNFRDSLDTKNRVSAIVDENGNRTSITLDGE